MAFRRFLAIVTLAGFVSPEIALAALPASVFPRPAVERSARVAPEPPAASATGAPDRYGRWPLSFEENRGQADAAARFFTRGPGFVGFVTGTGLVLALRRPVPGAAVSPARDPRAALETAPPALHDLVRMSLLGARPQPAIEGIAPLSGTVNYFIGDDRTKWRTDVPTYARVETRGVYQGVDVVYYGNGRQLEYDFVVAPGADPRVIRMAFEGAERIWTDVRGDLVLALPGRELRLRKPLVYQPIGRERRTVESAYRVVAAGERVEVAFEVGAWDRARPLVIDPVLVYATFLGGSGYDQPFAVAADAAGNAYVTGSTQSVDFPLAGALQGVLPASNGAAFVTKVNPAGTAILYSTYVGGRNGGLIPATAGYGIAVDPTGSAYVAGATVSLDFPVTASAFQPWHAGGLRDAIVFKLGPGGSALVYSTLLGGSGDEGAQAIAVDGLGQAVVGGFTRSADFPVAAAVQGSLGGSVDGFIAKLTADGSDVVYSTFLGGVDFDYVAGLALDPASNVYATGSTSSDDFPTANPLRGFGGGSSDGFVVKLDPAGATLVYSTYLGGNGSDSGTALAVDAAGNAYVGGYTDSTDFPTVGAPQPARSGSQDGFVTKINPAGTAILYSTYLGGGDQDIVQGLALTGAGSVWAVGYTSSSNFPVTVPLPPGSLIQAAFVARLDPVTGVTFGQVLDTNCPAEAITANAAGNVYVTGIVCSGFSATTGVVQHDSLGSPDGFLVRYRGLPDLLVRSVSVPAGTVLAPGHALTATVTVTNRGDVSANSVTRVYLANPAGTQRIVRTQLALAALAPGANVSTPAVVTIPKTQPAGNYVLQACADDLNQVVEESETNNCAVSPVLHLPKPDLAVSAVVPAAPSISRGSRLGVTATVRNQGEVSALASMVRVFLGTGSTRQETDVHLTPLLGIGALAAGQNASATGQYTIPATLSPGGYYVIACADDKGTIAESNETNNCLGAPVMVLAPLAPPRRLRR